jgi:ribosomal protein S18 acetylase RimI-like enzyme
MIEIEVLSGRNIPEILRIQQECYSGEFLESASSFLHKFSLIGNACFGAWEDQYLCGYLFSHPWKLGEVVALHIDEYDIPSDADCIYIHDLAVAPIHRQKQIPQRLISALCATIDAGRPKIFALVAVQNSEAFWSRWGFKVHHKVPYGGKIDSSYMICRGIPSWK